jgi:hypothetical protein
MKGYKIVTQVIIDYNKKIIDVFGGLPIVLHIQLLSRCNKFHIVFHCLKQINMH